MSVEEYLIYDVFHNDNNKLVIVMPVWYVDPGMISCDNINFIQHSDKRHARHDTYILISDSEIKYTPTIQLKINDEIVEAKVNKYPEFRDEIIMSTQVCGEDDYIRQWIIFHLSIGVQRFIIYDNSHSKIKYEGKEYSNVSNNLSATLSDFILDGTVLLINWPYPWRGNWESKYKSRSGQSTQQNHSIWAFQNSKYIGLFDVDEYINMQTHTNISDFFNDLIENEKLDTNEIGSFRLLNKFFYNPNNLPVGGFEFLKIYNCDNVTLSHPNGTRMRNEKNFVIPKNVFAYYIHSVTNGKPMYTLNADDIYFNHYCYINQWSRGRNNSNLLDDSISKHTLGLKDDRR